MFQRRVLFSNMCRIILLFLLQSSLSLAQASNVLSCYVPAYSPVTITCTIDGNRMKTPLMQEHFRAVQLHVVDEDRYYPIAEYFVPISALILNITGEVPIIGDALKGFPRLTTFEIHNSKNETISLDIQPDLFKNTPTLKHIQFTGISLSSSTLPAIRQSPNVNMLQVKNCGELIFKNGMFSGMNYLESIVFQDNKIRSIEDGAFEGLPCIVEISLISNRITYLPQNLFDNVPSLQILDMRKNQIGSIPPGIFHPASGLTSLTLSSNNIKRLDSGTFSGLTNLNNLDLSNSKLETIVDHVFNDTPKLCSLRLNNNNLTRIKSGTFKGLMKLQYLYLANNTLSTIEDNSLDDSMDLNYLNMGGNPITVLPDGLFRYNRHMYMITLGGGTCIENLSPANFTRSLLQSAVIIDGNCEKPVVASAGYEFTSPANEATAFLPTSFFAYSILLISVCYKQVFSN